uniref:Uncharacterized protein n=1 Tax=Anguilla anguilla TaxID=7936 RepID=A0A0E9TPR8_ANGAN
MNRQSVVVRGNVRGDDSFAKELLKTQEK